MTLPVRIEAKAWTDSRYGTVALYLGLSAGDAEIALIRCAAIWRWQTEHYTDDAPTYVVPEGVVIGALKSLDGPRALVAAGLAEVADGGLRIKGGRDDRGESRIDWYWRDRQQRSAAGKASESRRGAGGRFGSAKPAEPPTTTDGPPTVHRRSTDATPADDQRRTDSPDSGLRTPEDQITHTARAGDPAAGKPVGQRPDSPGALVMAAADRLTAARRAIDPAALPVTEANAREVLARLAEAGQDARKRLDHALACVEARARSTRTVDALGWSSFASEKAWAWIQQSSVEGYAAGATVRGHAGQRDGPRRQPPNRGQAPALVTQRPDGDLPI